MTRSAFPHTNISPRQSRREMLMESAGGLGGIALASMLAGEKAIASEQHVEVVHHPPRAKRVVQLFMSGAASHLDLQAPTHGVSRKPGRQTLECAAVA